MCIRDSAKAGSLPYGAQRRLEIARALATNPSLLLLDEPAAGMNPSETAELMETIRKIRDTFQIAVLLIEHDMSLVMNICEGIAVLNFGRVIAKEMCIRDRQWASPAAWASSWRRRAAPWASATFGPSPIRPLRTAAPPSFCCM